MNQSDAHTKIRVVPGATLRAMAGIGQAVEARMEAALGALAVTWPQYEILQALCLDACPMLSELADRVRCVRSNITALVDRLERDGLVRRIPNPEDRRSLKVELTQAGFKAYTEAAHALEQVEDEILGGLSAEEQKILRIVFERLMT